MDILRAIAGIVLDSRRLGVISAVKGFLGTFGSGRFHIEISGVGTVWLRRGDSDYQTIRQIFVKREYDTLSAEFDARLSNHYDEILNSGRTPVIVDAGANIGAAALWFAKRWPRAQIVCVEPDPKNFDCLKANTVNQHSIRAVFAAVGSAPGYVSVVAQDKSWASQVERAESGIPVVTVPNVVSMVPGGVPFIIKLDIEGFESELFSRDVNWVRDAYAIYIEPHDWMLPGKRTSQGFQKAISYADFELLLRGENILYIR